MSLGDKLFDIFAVTFAVIFFAGWVLLLAIMLLKYVFPNKQDSLEIFLRKTSMPLGLIQKYSGYGMLILLAIRFIAALLGWGPPLPIGDE